MSNRSARPPRTPDPIEFRTEPATLTPPANDDELHEWIRRECGIFVPRRALLEHSHAPFAYIAHSFFERDAIADCVVWANRGGGKTFLGALATALDLIFKPGIEVRVLGGSMDQSRRMHAHLRRIFDPRARPHLAELVSGKVTDKRLVLRNGSEVELLAQSQTSIRGTRVQKLRCDEVDLFHPEVWEAAQLTTRSKRCGTFEVRGSVDCLSTMHVPHGVMHTLLRECRAGTRALFRWGAVDVLERCDDTHACHSAEQHCALWDECGGRAKAEGVKGFLRIDDALRMKQRVSASAWKTEMLCERATRGSSVLPEFDARTHVVDALPFTQETQGLLWIGGMDFGWRAPTVVLWAAVDAQGTLWIVDERVRRGTVLDEHIDAIRTGVPALDTEPRTAGRMSDHPPGRVWPALAWIGVDPAGDNVSEQTGVSSVSRMRQADICVKIRRMGVLEGLQLVRARLAPADGSRPRLFVHERCEDLIESLERYHYPEDDPESDVPVKRDGFDHCVDALRYMIQNLDKPYRTERRAY